MAEWGKYSGLIRRRSVYEIARERGWAAEQRFDIARLGVQLTGSTGGTMTRFQFVLSSPESVRHAGVVQSDSFSDAMTALSQRLPAERGDVLEISVEGFPPARYECVLALEGGSREWKPRGQMAA
jgi:hypothetical protein